MTFRPESFDALISNARWGKYVDFAINYYDWEALYMRALSCNDKVPFANQIPQYPMLSRIQDMYEEYRFSLDEANILRSECVTAAQTCDHEPAIRTLRKLIYICDAAIEKNLGFWLMCD